MLTLKQLALKSGAEYRGEDMLVPRFSIDSRTLEKGEVFVALRVGRDGHEYVESAVKKGAAAILVDHPMDFDVPQIIGKDTLQTFGHLAHHWRVQFRIPVIGLTGTCGKTTTKEMIASILHEKGNTLASFGTFNNAYGVPLTLLRLRPEHQFAVIEMGTNSPGEIAYLAEMAEPSVALITNIGASHLEKLGDFAGVSKEKSDIFQHLTEQGVAILNQDEPFMESWAQKIGKRHRVTYSMHAHKANVFATDIHFSPEGASFDLHTPIGVQTIAIPLPGHHIAVNAVSAAATCLAVGVSLENIGQGLAKLEAIDRRFKQYTFENGAILIDDSYNTSIASVQNAIETLKTFPGRKILTLSNYRELGDHTIHYQQEFGKWLVQAKFDLVCLYGDKEVLKPTLALYPQAEYFDDKAKLIQKLNSEIRNNTVVLVKGAKYFKMYEVVEALLKENECVD